MAELRLGADAKHPNPGYLNLLTEMGYPHDKAVSALLAVKNESLDHAIDWLDKHRDELDAELVQQQEHRPFLGGAAAAAPASSSSSNGEALLQSDVRPDGLSRSKLEAERKAHADFKRQKQMQEERELLKKKEQDAKIVREKYAKEKAEKAAAAAAKKNPANVSASVVVAAAAPAASPSSKLGASTNAVIQVRLPNRPPVVVQGLTAGSSLTELYARVDAECGRVDYVLTQPFPPPVTHFTREEHRTLGELGLAPRAALTVTDLASLGKVVQGVGGPPAVAPIANPFGGGGGGVAVGGGGGGVGGGPPPAVLGGGGDEGLGVAHKYRGAPGQVCPVCQSPLEGEQDVRTLPCGHVLHDECAQEWRAENPGNCPQNCNL